MNHLVTALTLGDSYIDANPEQEEEDSKAHEEGRHQGDEELFVNVACVLGGGDLVTRGTVKEKPRELAHTFNFSTWEAEADRYL